MPAGDRTGPWGLGPGTGRGLGYCSGYPAPGLMFPGPGLGFARGFGRGFGRGTGLGHGRGFWRRGLGGFYGYPYPGWHPGFYAPCWSSFYPPNREEEKAVLEEQARILEEQLDGIKARLKDLKKADKEKEKEKEKGNEK